MQTSTTSSQTLRHDPDAGSNSGAISTQVSVQRRAAIGGPITTYLENDGRLEHAQQMAGHESPRTTKLYHRTKDEITLSEVERIRL